VNWTGVTLPVIVNTFVFVKQKPRRLIIKKRVSLIVDKKSDHEKARQVIRLSAPRRSKGEGARALSLGGPSQGWAVTANR
jgi:hypothetical protein